ncbi:hypothetical protein P7C73_g5947, partial [Tremellales sp. Uapishka_1]
MKTSGDRQSSPLSPPPLLSKTSSLELPTRTTSKTVVRNKYGRKNGRGGLLGGRVATGAASRQEVTPPLSAAGEGRSEAEESNEDVIMEDRVGTQREMSSAKPVEDIERPSVKRGRKTLEQPDGENTMLGPKSSGRRSHGVNRKKESGPNSRLTPPPLAREPSDAVKPSSPLSPALSSPLSSADIPPVEPEPAKKRTKRTQSFPSIPPIESTTTMKVSQDISHKVTKRTRSSLPAKFVATGVIAKGIGMQEESISSKSRSGKVVGVPVRGTKRKASRSTWDAVVEAKKAVMNAEDSGNEEEQEISGEAEGSAAGAQTQDDGEEDEDEEEEEEEEEEDSTESETEEEDESDGYVGSKPNPKAAKRVRSTALKPSMSTIPAKPRAKTTHKTKNSVTPEPAIEATPFPLLHPSEEIRSAQRSGANGKRRLDTIDAQSRSKGKLQTERSEKPSAAGHSDVEKSPVKRVIKRKSKPILQPKAGAETSPLTTQTTRVGTSSKSPIVSGETLIDVNLGFDQFHKRISRIWSESPTPGPSHRSSSLSPAPRALDTLPDTWDDDDEVLPSMSDAFAQADEDNRREVEEQRLAKQREKAQRRKINEEKEAESEAIFIPKLYEPKYVCECLPPMRLAADLRPFSNAFDGCTVLVKEQYKNFWPAKYKRFVPARTAEEFNTKGDQYEIRHYPSRVRKEHPRKDVIFLTDNAVASCVLGEIVKRKKSYKSDADTRAATPAPDGARSSCSPEIFLDLPRREQLFMIRPHLHRVLRDEYPPAKWRSDDFFHGSETRKQLGLEALTGDIDDDDIGDVFVPEMRRWALRDLRWHGHSTDAEPPRPIGSDRYEALSVALKARVGAPWRRQDVTNTVRDQFVLDVLIPEAVVQICIRSTSQADMHMDVASDADSTDANSDVDVVDVNDRNLDAEAHDDAEANPDDGPPLSPEDMEYQWAQRRLHVLAQNASAYDRLVADVREARKKMREKLGLAPELDAYERERLAEKEKEDLEMKPRRRRGPKSYKE